jgi:hypothetical protein
MSDLSRFSETDAAPVVEQSTNPVFDLRNRTVTLDLHEVGDIHHIGRSLPTPARVADLNGTPSVGKSSRPAREDHTHGYEPGSVGFDALDPQVPRGLLKRAGMNSPNQTAISSIVDLTGLSITFTVDADRWFKVSAWVYFFIPGAAGQPMLYIRDGANNVRQHDKCPVVLASNGYWAAKPWFHFFNAGAPASFTYKLSAQSITGGNVDAAHDHNWAGSFIIAEDIGPVV